MLGVERQRRTLMTRANHVRLDGYFGIGGLGRANLTSNQRDRCRQLCQYYEKNDKQLLQMRESGGQAATQNVKSYCSDPVLGKGCTNI